MRLLTGGCTIKNDIIYNGNWSALLESHYTFHDYDRYETHSRESERSQSDHRTRNK